MCFHLVFRDVVVVVFVCPNLFPFIVECFYIYFLLGLNSRPSTRSSLLMFIFMKHIWWHKCGRQQQLNSLSLHSCANAVYRRLPCETQGVVLVVRVAQVIMVDFLEYSWEFKNKERVNRWWFCWWWLVIDTGELYLLIPN